MRLADLDRAVIIVMLGRVWAMGAGLVTIAVIASRMSPETQGYHYTFLSLLGLQTFAELNLSYVIVQFAAHEWAHLRLDADGAVTGDADAHSRLASIARFAMRWYVVAAVLFAVAAGAVGGMLLAGGNEAIRWRVPWTVLMVVAGAQLIFTPLLALLEGAHQVERVYTIRLAAAIATSVTTWLVLFAGGGLWAAPAGLAAGVTVTFAIVATRYRAFFQSLLQPPPGATVHWRGEIWQMQWRLGVGGVGNYFVMGLLVPVVFRYHGAAEAGRLGVGIQLAASLTTLASAWITPRIPRFGALIAQRRFEDLDRLFFRVTTVSTVAAAVGGCVLVVGAAVAESAGFGFSDRIATPMVLAVLALSTVVGQVTFSIAAYLRAHRRDPLVGITVVASASIGVFVWIFGARSGAIGAVSARLAVLALLVLPYEIVLWRHRRREWHRVSEEISA